MKTLSYLTGNLLFDGNLVFKPDAKLRIKIQDVTVRGDEELVYEKDIPFEAKSLAIFRYLPFELKDFEFDASRRYELTAHVDQQANGQIESGDYATDRGYPVVTAMTEVDMNLVRVP